ncbi:hypothetical protein [Paenibacillus aceti]|uniref:Uncharacterized protein n=1 Tax=Paenibacillus aceti TaxID=1820010 RepID=A0ABQ1VPL7_9BACL|nr:hypothetical protein [Paenibacillus aceti]GGF83057.1 hypothetical protein GCM10010913_00690 [Paenibacillus aceti]
MNGTSNGVSGPYKRAGEGASPDGLAHEMAAQEHGELFVKSGFAGLFQVNVQRFTS